MARVILHIDLNAFFASVEQIKDPSTKGKPLIVGGKFKRGVVSTASYEARKYGIHSGMPISQALKLCPHVINKEVDFASYNEYSNKFFALIKKACGNKIEIASIDECFVDFSNEYKKVKSVEKYLRNLQKNIYKELGLGCSIGVSYNKFLAKMASDMKKPMGLVILRKKDLETKLWPLPIEKMFGIGKKTAPKLRALGINTIGDLANSDEDYQVKRVLGKMYYTFLNWANGIDESEVIDYEVDAKSISNSTTFLKDLTDPKEIKEKLKELSKTVSSRLGETDFLAYGVDVVIRFSDFKTINRSAKFDTPFSTEEEIYLKALKLFEDNYNGDKAVRLLGVGVFDLKEKSKILKQMDFYDLELLNNDKNVDNIIRKLNKVLGKKVFKKASEVKKKND